MNTKNLLEQVKLMMALQALKKGENDVWIEHQTARSCMCGKPGCMNGMAALVIGMTPTGGAMRKALAQAFELKADALNTPEFIMLIESMSRMYRSAEGTIKTFADATAAAEAAGVPMLSKPTDGLVFAGMIAGWFFMKNPNDEKTQDELGAHFSLGSDVFSAVFEYLERTGGKPKSDEEIARAGHLARETAEALADAFQGKGAKA